MWVLIKGVEITQLRPGPQGPLTTGGFRMIDVAEIQPLHTDTKLNLGHRV